MMTTFTIDSYVLEAMLAFTSTNRSFNAHTVLLKVLVEVTPGSVRLVSTDTHTLGLLHLTPILGYHLDIQCEEPVSLVLPIEQFKPVLKDRKSPVTVTLDGEQVSITAVSGLALTLPGRPATEFPCYERVLSLTPVTPTTRTAYDLSLLAKFAAFAKTMGQSPYLDLAFHGPISPVSVRISGLSGFYGILMPRQIAYEEPIPAFLLPPQLPTEEAPRLIRLHDVEGVAKLAGVDDDGLHWVQFEVDEFAEQESGTCSICGAEITSGWLCGDGGEEVCDEHVEIIENEMSLPHADETPVPIPA
jgi:hypothetical protein